MIEFFQKNALLILIIGAPWALATRLILNPKIQSRLLGPQRLRAKPWGGVEVLAIFLLIQIIWIPLALELLLKSGVLDRFYGPGFTEAYRQDTRSGGSSLSVGRVQMWLSILV